MHPRKNLHMTAVVAVAVADTAVAASVAAV